MRRSLMILLMLTSMTGCDDRASTTSAQPTKTVESARAVVPASQPTTLATKPTEPETLLPTTQMTIKDHAFTLEVADDDSEQQRGLMFRNALGADNGMIFVFPNEQRRGFWMKNTYIPLDILYVAADGKIVSIQKMYAQDESTYDSIWPAQYAIELNAGTANRIGLKSGDVLMIPESIKPKSPN